MSKLKKKLGTLGSRVAKNTDKQEEKSDVIQSKSMQESLDRLKDREENLKDLLDKKGDLT